MQRSSAHSEEAAAESGARSRPLPEPRPRLTGASASQSRPRPAEPCGPPPGRVWGSREWVNHTSLNFRAQGGVSYSMVGV